MKQNNQPSFQLGCGLIRIGRVWGVDSKPVPTEAKAQEFLETAFELGIRFFDTAPAYGLSEDRLGTFLKKLTAQQRSEITVATKFGEHWDTETNQTFVDHSYKKLQESYEKSLSKLGKIDLLQLHKAGIQNLQSDDVSQAFEFVRKSGTTFLGASISDLETGAVACKDARLQYIQLPYNQERSELLAVIQLAKENSKKILFNRPFAMGAITLDTTQTTKKAKMVEAFKFIQKTNCPGVILSGTGSPEHLKENLGVFKKVIKKSN